MSFLAPIFFAGLTAIGLPILFHLIRRTPRSKLPFGSLMFLTPSPPRLTRRSRLDNLFLLLLRALALALIAFAFARPFFREAAQLSFQETRGRRVMIVLDTSASMRRADCWQQARRHLTRVLNELEPGDDLGLLTFDDRVQTRVELARDSSSSARVGDKRALIRQAVERLEPGWGGSRVGLAVRTAAESLRVTNDLQQSDAALQVELISDLQRGAEIASLQDYEWPPEVALALHRVAAPKPSNASIRILHDETLGIGDSVRVRVSNSADSAVDQFRLEWRPKSSTETAASPISLYVPPGQSRVIQVSRGETDRTADHLLLSGDDHPFDNRCFTAPIERQQLRVAYFGDDQPEDPEGTQYYLRMAMEETFLRRVAFIDAAKEEAGWKFGSPEVDAAESELPDMMIATSGQLSRQRELFESYLDAGGQLLYVVTDPAEAAELEGLVSGAALALEADPPSGGDYAMLGEVEFAHPVFAPFAGAKYNDFTKIHFWKHARFELPPESSARVLAEFDDGSPALWEQAIGSGRLYVLSSGWDPESSTLARSTKFVPLLDSLLDQAVGTSRPLPSFAVHDAVPLPCESSDATVRTPAGGAVTLARAEGEFLQTDEPGIYSVEQDGQTYRFAVNLPFRESDTTPLEVEQLEQFGVRFGVHATRSEEIARERQLRDLELERRQQLWQWLLAAGLGVLCLETVIAGRLAHRDRHFATQDGEAQ